MKIVFGNTWKDHGLVFTKQGVGPDLLTQNDQYHRWRESTSFATLRRLLIICHLSVNLDVETPQSVHKVCISTNSARICE